ncbi:MAG: hypothetical protein HC806_02360 [Anaerolineae bacterium]|nr:hypothetical protein [Anaerolineae bacterium]
MLVLGVIFVMLLTAAAPHFHPGCLVAEGEGESDPRIPGLPCLPTPPPAPDPAEEPTPPEKGLVQQGPVRLEIFNASELPFSLWLDGPGVHVLNVPSGESRVFVVSRGAYTFEMTLCGASAQGEMRLEKMTTLSLKPCSSEKLVEISIENTTQSTVWVALSGPENLILSVPAGMSKSFTIPRGDYSFSAFLCKEWMAGMFEARSHRVMELSCP